MNQRTPCWQGFKHLPNHFHGSEMTKMLQKNLIFCLEPIKAVKPPFERAWSTRILWQLSSPPSNVACPHLPRMWSERAKPSRSKKGCCASAQPCSKPSSPALQSPAALHSGPEHRACSPQASTHPPLPMRSASRSWGWSLCSAARAAVLAPCLQRQIAP